MASRFWVGGTGTWDASDTAHWSATSGGAGGQSVPVAGDDVTIDASSGAGTITVATDFSIRSLTCGAMGMTLDFSANNNSPTLTGAITTSGTGTRTINWGSGTFTLSGSNFTIFANGTTTNQTMTGSATFNFTYSGGTGTRAFQFGGTGAGTFHTSTTCSVNITAGTDIVSFSGTNTGLPSLNFTGFSGTWSSTSTSIAFGTNLTMSATMTNSVTAILQWTVASSSGTITSNGKSFASAFIVNATSGTVTLADAFVTTSSLTLTLGTFNANGFNVTCGLFSSSNSNTRVLTMGSGTWTLTGTGTVWNITTVTGMTFSGASATIVFSDTSASSKTWVSNSGVSTYGNITIPGGGSGAIIFSGNSGKTFANFTVAGPKTIQFPSTRTYTITNLNITGTAGNLVTLTSDIPGSQYTLSVASGTVNAYYVSLQDSLATGGATFRALNGVNVGNNTGWLFFSSRVAATNRFLQRNENAAILANGIDGSAGNALSIPNNASLSPTAAVTLELWFRPVSRKAGILFDNSTSGTTDSYFLSMGTDGGMNWFSTIGGIAKNITGTVTKAKFNEWNMVSATYDGSAIRFFLNGSQLAETLAATGSLGTNSGPLRIGAYYTGGISATFHGSLSSPRVYAAGCTLAEHQDRYYRSITSAALQAALVLDLNTEIGAGSTVTDLSGLGNNATMGASASWTSDSPFKSRKASVNANMVKNGDFEYAPPFTAATSGNGRWIDGTAAGSLTNDLFRWSMPSTPVGTCSAQFDSSVSHSGAYSLKLSTLATNSSCTASSYLSNTAANHFLYGQRCLPNMTYTVTVWMKTTVNSGSATSGAYLILREQNAAGSTVSSSNSTTKVNTTTDWTQYSLTVTTSSTSYYFGIDLNNKGNDGSATLIMDAWFDDIVLTPVYPEGRVPANGNLVKNFDFEVAPTFVAATSTAGRWIDGTAAGSTTNATYKWAFFSKSGTGTVQFDNTVFHGSAQSLKGSITATSSNVEVANVLSSSAASSLASAIPVAPSTNYTVSFWMKTNYVSGDSSDGAFVLASLRDSSGTGISSTSSTKVKTTVDWTQYSFTVATTAATSFVYLELEVKGNTGAATLIMDAWFDDIYLAPTTNPGRVIIT